MKAKVNVFLLAVFLVNTVIASAQSFREEEVTFSNGDVSLSGTLSFPEQSAAKARAIILISGSGPQNRDSEIFGMKPFKLLADFLNSKGYAVLRYDDRGVGKSTGKSVNQSTSAELAEDVRQAFRFLQTRADIDVARIGLLGHSEGGIIAPMVAVMEPSVAFIILAAGFGVKGVELSNAQQAAIMRANGMEEKLIKASCDMNREVMSRMSDPAFDETELKEFVKQETLKLLPLLPEMMQAQITDKEGYAMMAANQAVMQARNPWIRYYMSYDPLPTLKQVKCPVLMLFGELDVQVVADQNNELMLGALQNEGNTAVVSVTIPKANHLFQEAVTGSPAEYGTLKKEFVPEFLSTIKNWLSKIK